MLTPKWSAPPDTDKEGYPEQFHTNARLDPVRLIAKKGAAVPIQLFNKSDLRNDPDTAEPLKDNPLYDLLDAPCPSFVELDGYALRYMTFAHYVLCGEFFWLKVRNGRNIVALLPVPSFWVAKRPTVGDHTFQIYPYGVTSGTVLTVDRDDVVWFKDPDLLDPYGNGRGSAEAIGDEIESDEYAAKWQKRFFFNDATPPYIITGVQGGPAQVEQIKQGLKDKLAGFMHTREPGVLATPASGNNQIKIEKLGTEPKELDLVASRKFLRDEALQHWNIPPEVFGIIENSNRATIDAAFYLFNKNVLADFLNMFERTLNAQLIAIDYSKDIVCKHNFKIKEDDEFALKVYNDGLSKGVITRNEYRRRFGLSEDSVNGDVYLMPFSSVEQAQDEMPEEPDVLDIEPDESETEEPTKSVKSVDDDEDRRLKVWQAFDSKATSTEPGFKKQVRKIASAQNKDINKIVTDATTDGASIDVAIDKYFKLDETAAATKRTLAPAWIYAMEAGRDHANSMLERKAASDLSITNQMFNIWVEQYGLEKAKEINDTTNKMLKKKLTTVLADSIANGDSLANRIKKLIAATDGVYENMSKIRAELIARTEATTTVNYGSFATYKAEDVKEKEWIYTHDDRTRDAHKDIDPVIVGIDESFNVGGEMMSFPGDPTASAANVCNCRCTIAPVMR